MSEPTTDCTPPPGTRLVLFAEGLMEQMTTRSADGNRLTFAWGEPDEHGWYTPVITEHYDDNLVRDLAATIVAAVEDLPAWAYPHSDAAVDRAAVLRAIREASDGRA